MTRGMRICRLIYYHYAPVWNDDGPPRGMPATACRLRWSILPVNPLLSRSQGTDSNKEKS
jgi:hypothetical protein